MEPVPNIIIETTEYLADDGSVTSIRSICSGGVPSEAIPAADQLVEFQYRLNVQRDVDAARAIAAIERHLHTNMTRSILSCTGAVEKPFTFSGLNSLPEDAVLAACSEVEETTNDCYMVQGGITVDILHWEGRRSLQQGEIADLRLVQKLGPFLSDAFRSDWLRGSHDGIVDLQFRGFSNVQTGATTPDGFDEEESSAAGLRKEIKPGVSDGSKVPIAMSSLAIAIAAMVLLLVSVVGTRQVLVNRKRHEQKNEEIFIEQAPEIEIDNEQVSRSSCEEKVNEDS